MAGLDPNLEKQFKELHYSYRTLKEQIDPIIEGFVKEQNGRFQKHASDQLLKTMLSDFMIRDSTHYFAGGFCLRSTVHSKLGQTAYDVGVRIFENFLEGGCQVICNGHHVAQSFAQAFKPLTEMPKLKDALLPASYSQPLAS